MKIKSVLCLIAAFLLVVPSLLIPGIVSFSDESAEETLFFSSFEDGEDHAVSCKTLESSGVKPAEYGIKGKGLAIDLSTVDGSVDYVGNENKFNLFDAKTGTKFLTEDSYVYVQFALEQPAKVTS
ncbi:MAG: hypothetical protein J6V01_02090, partial [Clostridia bacterium]|nr:hypothetical protein [Clostridia bacterium]